MSDTGTLRGPQLNIKVMTEETPKKKPRRKRRTKAEIAAEKADKEVELNFGSSYEKEIDEIIIETFEESVLEPKEESVESTDCDTCGGESADAALAAAEAAVVEQPEPQEPYIELTGLAKIKARIEQRRLRRMHS